MADFKGEPRRAEKRVALGRVRSETYQDKKMALEVLNHSFEHWDGEESQTCELEKKQKREHLHPGLLL